MPTRREIEQKVIEMVEEVLTLNKPPKLKDSFREDLDADSIDIVTLFVSLEDELEITFDQDLFEGKNTILSVVDVLEELLSDSQDS